MNQLFYNKFPRAECKSFTQTLEPKVYITLSAAGEDAKAVLNGASITQSRVSLKPLDFASANAESAEPVW